MWKVIIKKLALNKKTLEKIEKFLEFHLVFTPINVMKVTRTFSQPQIHKASTIKLL